MNESKPQIPKEDALALWRQQADLFFSRFQTASAIEVAAFAGWYSICNDHPKLAFALMVGSSILVGCIIWFMHGDRKDAKLYRGIYFDGFRDDRRPPRILGIKVYGMQGGLYVMYGLLALNVVFAVYGCSCILGDVWRCRA